MIDSTADLFESLAKSIEGCIRDFSSVQLFSGSWECRAVYQWHTFIGRAPTRYWALCNLVELLPFASADAKAKWEHE